MKKFLVTYLAPLPVLEEWKKTDPATREEAEKKMRGQWQDWMGAHHQALVDMGAGVGKTKLVTTAGVSDTKNDIMLYCIVEASSHEEAAAMFKDHPHLGIPQASIEVMEVNPLSGMKDI